MPTLLNAWGKESAASPMPIICTSTTLLISKTVPGIEKSVVMNLLHKAEPRFTGCVKGDNFDLKTLKDSFSIPIFPEFRFKSTLSFVIKGIKSSVEMLTSLFVTKLNFILIAGMKSRKYFP